MECTNTFLYICLCLLGLCLSLLGSESLSVLLLSVAVVVCAVWLVALCGICTWCQRKLGKRNKPGMEAASSPDSVRGRGENKAIK
uniref:Synaptotagmin VIIa n=1 Tax=Poecilia mexicana TaxID=48701 RepID=A0A3B3Y370_9TELE